MPSLIGRGPARPSPVARRVALAVIAAVCVALFLGSAGYATRVETESAASTPDPALEPPSRPAPLEPGAHSVLAGTIVPGGIALPVTIGNTSENALITFQGHAHERVSLDVGAVSIPFSFVSIRGPDGSDVVAPTLVGSDGGFLEPVSLPTTATYTIFFDPQGPATGSTTLTLHDLPADAVGTITADGRAVTATTDVPGQNAVYRWRGSRGERVSLDVTDIKLDSDYELVKIVSPDGSVTAGSGPTSTGHFFEPLTLPTTGAYTVVVDPHGAATGSTSLTLHRLPERRVTRIAIGGATRRVAITIPGAEATLAFTGRAGAHVSIRVANSTVPFSRITIRASNGPALAGELVSAGAAVVGPTLLPVDGVYTLVVDPWQAQTGALSLALVQVGGQASSGRPGGGAVRPQDDRRPRPRHRPTSRPLRASETPIVDDFNRPNEALSDGGKWTRDVLGSGENGLQVVSNQLACGYTSTRTAWRNDRRYGPDTEVAVTIVTKPGNGNAVRLYARLQTPGSSSFDGYWVRYQDNSGTDQVFIERIDASVITMLATLNQEFAAGDRLKIRAIGSDIQAWRYDGASWSEIGSATDSTYGGAGYVGIGLRGTTGRLDDFRAESLSPPPTPDPTPILDSFDRANENPLSDGGKWSNDVLGSGESGLKIVSNQLACSYASTRTAWRNDQRYGPDTEVTVTVDTKPGVGNVVRLYARLQTPGSASFDGYELRFLHNSGTDQVLIERVDASVFTTLRTVDQELTAGDELKLRVIGSSIQAWRYDGLSWSEVGEVSDSTYTGRGYVGVGLRGTSGRLDDFRATSLSPPPIPDPSHVLDNFNRPNEDPLSDSGNWTNGVAGPSDGGLKVVSNQLASSSGVTVNAWRNSPYGPDEFAAVTIARKPGVGNAVRLYARLQTPGTTSYDGYMLLFLHNAGTDQVLIDRIDNGVYTILATMNQEITDGDELKIRAVGSSIQAWRYDGTGWSKLGEASDSTYAGGGYVGVGLRGTSGRLDDFRDVDPPPKNDAISIEGVPAVGQTLTIDSTWEDATSLAQQWYRCDYPRGAFCVPIANATDGSYVATAYDINFTLKVSQTATNAYGSTTAESQPTQPIVSSPLLWAYAPELRYDSEESYFADSAAEMTDNQQTTGSGSYANQLLDPGEDVIAAADDPNQTLSLNYLWPIYYPDGRVVTPEDHIKEAHDTIETDAQRMHGLSRYRDQIYGRVVPTDFGYVIQYWFFYYFNSHPGGDHEGDWEMIQIFLDPDFYPLTATFAHHNEAERCDWIHVQRTEGTRPIVYVALGSHASYFSSGSHLWQAGAAADYVDGQTHVSPSVIDVPTHASDTPGWMQWPGRWGGTGYRGSDSPTGPEQHYQWAQPVDWQNNANGCTEVQTYPFRGKTTEPREIRAARVQPAAPIIRARRVGSRAVITYRFPTFPRGARHPTMIATSVKSAGKRYGPLTVWTRVRAPHGRIVQKIGLGRAPFRVLASAFSRGGGRSRIVSVPLR